MIRIPSPGTAAGRHSRRAWEAAAVEPPSCGGKNGAVAVRHFPARLALPISALLGTCWPILVHGAPGPPAPRPGDGPDVGAIVQQALRAAGEVEEGRDRSLVLLDLARFQLLTGA